MTSKYEQQAKARKKKRKVSKMKKKFPDYSGDGKVTRKDILMGIGVLPKKRGK